MNGRLRERQRRNTIPSRERESMSLNTIPMRKRQSRWSRNKTPRRER